MCSGVATKALSSLRYKTHTTNVSVVHEVTLANRQDTRRLRFSFFLQRCQTAGKLLLSFRFMQPTKNPPVPLSGNTGVSASCTLNSHRNVGSCLQRRVPQWPLYRSPHAEVSSVCWKNFANAKKPRFTWVFAPRCLWGNAISALCLNFFPAQLLVLRGASGPLNNLGTFSGCSAPISPCLGRIAA